MGLNKLFSKLSFILLIILSYTLPAKAESEWVVVPKFTLLEKNASFQSTSGANDIDLDIDVVTAEVSLTMSKGDWYGTLSYDRSLNSGYAFEEGRELNMIRYDYTALLGYSIIPELNAFIGYKDGASFVTSYDTSTNNYSDLIFRDNGVFGGLGGSFSFKKKFSISGSVAYASFSGRVELGGTAVTTAFESDGTTQGLSYNLAFNWLAGTNQTLQVGYKANRYSYSAKELELDQNFDMTYVSLIYFY